MHTRTFIPPFPLLFTLSFVFFPCTCSPVSSFILSCHFSPSLLSPSLLWPSLFLSTHPISLPFTQLLFSTSLSLFLFPSSCGPSISIGVQHSIHLSFVFHLFFLFLHLFFLFSLTHTHTHNTHNICSLTHTHNIYSHPTQRLRYTPCLPDIAQIGRASCMA